MPRGVDDDSPKCLNGFDGDTARGEGVQRLILIFCLTILIFCLTKEFRWRDAKRAREANDIVQAHVALAALDTRHVCPVKIGQLGELLLGQTAVLSESRATDRTPSGPIRSQQPRWSYGPGP